MRLVFRGSKIGDFNVTEVTKLFDEGVSYWELSGIVGVYVRGEEFTGGPEVNFLGQVNSRLDYILKIFRKNASDFSFSFRAIDDSIHTVDVKNVVDLSIEGVQWIYFGVYMDRDENTIYVNIQNITANLFDYSVLTLDNIYNLINKVYVVKVNYSIDVLTQSNFSFCNIDNVCIGINELIGKDLSFINRDENYYSLLIKAENKPLDPILLLEGLGYYPLDVLSKWLGVEAFQGKDFVDVLMDMLKGYGYKVIRGGVETEFIDAVAVYKDKMISLSSFGGVIENENRVYVEASFSKDDDLIRFENVLKGVIGVLRWTYLSKIENIEKHLKSFSVNKNFIRALISYKVYDRG